MVWIWIPALEPPSLCCLTGGKPHETVGEIMTQRTLMTSGSDGLQRWKTIRIHRFSRAAEDRFLTSSRQPHGFLQPRRMISSQSRCAAPRRAANSADRTPGCGPNVAAVRFSSSHLRTEHSHTPPWIDPGEVFPSAGCSLIQFDGESAPPWTGHGLWRRQARQLGKPISAHTGRRCFTRLPAVTKRYPRPGCRKAGVRGTLSRDPREGSGECSFVSLKASRVQREPDKWRGWNVVFILATWWNS